MTTKIRELYGTQGQTITCTLTSLASGSARESASVDNRSDPFSDVLLSVVLKTGAGSIGTDPWAYIFAAGTVDDGSNWPDTVTGSDAAITLNTTTQLRLLGAVWLGAASTVYKGGPWNVANVFGGIMPALWSIVVLNKCGVALSATGSDHKLLWQGQQNEIV